MTFETFASAQNFLLGAAFVIAFVMGAVVNKTNFCTMGAVSDVVNIGDSGRMRAWLLAIAVAVLGVAVLEFAGLARIGEAFPPYRMGQLNWVENVLGGLLFGIGMTLASGCGNKVLIRIGGGNLKSIVVLAIIAVIAYFMINPFPGSDETLMSALFIRWTREVSITLPAGQDLGALLGGAAGVRLALGLVLGAALLIAIYRSHEFRKGLDNQLGGIVVGLCVVAAWYVSSNVVVAVDGNAMTLPGFLKEWDFLSKTTEGKPAIASAVNPQSYTFINPMGQTFGYALAGAQSSFLTFGVLALAGVMFGSLAWALISRSFRIEWFVDGKDFLTHVIGAVLMGFGGVLGMGCTIGQGVTGISTLAIGSFLTFGAIVLGSALTMKVQYYKMVYEDEATVLSALLTGLVDLRLLPASLRRHEAV